ncbi:MAG: hypothetical protein NTY07_13160 [Bacteroidia bacterium]|nr:hypothetical protein [Bacteroidia bacterium]
MRTKFYLIGLLILTVLTVGCNSNGKPKDFDYGHIENSRYLNSFFGLVLALPSEWVIQSKEQIENIAKLGKNLAAGDNINLKAVISASEVNTANLLVVFGL